VSVLEIYKPALLNVKPYRSKALSPETTYDIPPLPVIIVESIPAPARVKDFVMDKSELHVHDPAGQTRVSPDAALEIADATVACEQFARLVVAALT
jgi:hypothetical protein